MAVETVTASIRPFTRQESASIMGEEEMREKGVMARNGEGLIIKKTTHNFSPWNPGGGLGRRLHPPPGPMAFSEDNA
jgi:hypothetical protein